MNKKENIECSSAQDAVPNKDKTIILLIAHTSPGSHMKERKLAFDNRAGFKNYRNSDWLTG